jgi:hypothetical protein
MKHNHNTSMRVYLAIRLVARSLAQSSWRPHLASDSSDRLFNSRSCLSLVTLASEVACPSDSLSPADAHTRGTLRCPVPPAHASILNRPTARRSRDPQMESCPSATLSDKPNHLALSISGPEICHNLRERHVSRSRLLRRSYRRLIASPSKPTLSPTDPCKPRVDISTRAEDTTGRSLPLGSFRL